MDALKSLVQPLVGSSGGMVDGMKLVLLGGTVETARRVSSSAWSHFVNSFFLTAHFSEEDYPYDWLMLWLSRRPEWQRSREFDTTTRSSTPGIASRIADNSFGDEDDEDGPNADNDDDPNKVKTRVVFQPTMQSTHTIFYKGHWLRVSRNRKDDGCQQISISVVARNNTILKQLILQAKREYEAESVHRIQIYFAESHGGWRWTDSRHKRPMSSIVLNPGVKEMLLADARDFLKSETWYADRGIPFRRGFLLHGVPGAGKSSLIHALAGELMLDVYVISLSASWMSDSTLTQLMGRVPPRCILLLEDLDAAFTRSVGRRDEAESEESNNKESKQNSSSSSGKGKKNKEQMSDVNTLSLSGLLNALDGVAAAEGRLLFATTNHLERLDPALSRPGRMDVWVEFKNASKWQAEALFRNFFPCMEEEDEDVDEIALDSELEGIQLPCPPTPSTSTSSASTWSRCSSRASFSSPSSTPHSASSRSNVASPRSRPVSEDFGGKNTAYLPPPVDPSIASAQHSAKPLNPRVLGELAKKFADAIPEEEFSVAALQGYLLKNKARPDVAANDAAAWVTSERAMRERLQREKEERERKERLARDRRKRELLEEKQSAEKKELEKKEVEVAELKAKLEKEMAEKEKAEKEKVEKQEKGGEGKDDEKTKA